MSLPDRLRRTVPLLGAVLALLLVLAGLTLLVGVLRHWLVALIAAGGAVVMLALGRRLQRRVPRGTILELDLEQGLVEHVPDVPGARLLIGRRMRLRDVVDALHRAAGDDRVAALVARVGAAGYGLATAQEVRDAVGAFRAAGKKTVAWAEVFGEASDATTDYYVAAAFDEVYLQPGSSLATTGILRRVPFLRGVLDKLAARVQFDHRQEYKSFMYRLTERELVPPHREMLESLTDGEFAQLVTGIAGGRGLDEAAVRDAIDGSPLLAEEARAAGLVDGLAYRDEVYERIKEETGGGLLYLDRYLKRAGRPHRKGDKMALVYAVGGVTRGKSRFSWFPTVEIAMGSDTVTGALREATEDDKVKAILLRVDSRGGSAVASEAIWRAVGNARRAGKPVIVSMGDVAGSGGYYISCGADRIVAQPGTLTGSIGVVSGKIVTATTLAKAGITAGEVARGANATFWSAGYDYDEPGWARLQAFLDDVYDRFRGLVADGRDLTPEQVEEVAKGRVWLGAQAAEIGLVDALGGLETALGLAREAAGLAPDAPVKLIEFPRRKRKLPWQKPDSSEAAAEAVGAALAAAAPYGRIAATLPAPERALTMTEP